MCLSATRWLIHPVFLRYVENLNSGLEENFDHTTHLFGKVYDVGAEKWRDLLSSKHVTGGMPLKTDTLYGAYVSGLTKHKLATLDDCEGFLASVISASQSFGPSFHAIVTFDIVRVPQANPTAMRYTKVHLVRLSPSVGEASLIAQASKAPLPKDKAMTAWSSVMLALASATPGRTTVVPSRESVMTRLLHDSMVLLLTPFAQLPLLHRPRLLHAPPLLSARCHPPTCNTKILPTLSAASFVQKVNLFIFFIKDLYSFDHSSAIQMRLPFVPTPCCSALISRANGCPLLEEAGAGRTFARALRCVKLCVHCLRCTGTLPNLMALSHPPCRTFLLLHDLFTFTVVKMNRQSLIASYMWIVLCCTLLHRKRACSKIWVIVLFLHKENHQNLNLNWRAARSCNSRPGHVR